MRYFKPHLVLPISILIAVAIVCWGRIVSDGGDDDDWLFFASFWWSVAIIPGLTVSSAVTQYWAIRERGRNVAVALVRYLVTATFVVVALPVLALFVVPWLVRHHVIPAGHGGDSGLVVIIVPLGAALWGIASTIVVLIAFLDARRMRGLAKATVVARAKTR